MINIEFVYKMAGVLGCLLSILVFILTRFERRKRVIIELELGSVERFCNFDDLICEARKYSTLLSIRVTNMAERPIVVNRDSFTIMGHGKTIKTFNTEWLGLHKIPSPLQKNSSFEIGLFIPELNRLLDKESLKAIMHINYRDKLVHLLTVEFQDLDGKLFRTKKYAYDFLTGMLCRKPNNWQSLLKKPDEWNIMQTFYEG
jgi:hypothetical protein